MIDSLPRGKLLGIAFFQGLAFFALDSAYELNIWPSESPLWAYPLWALAIAIPLFLLLSLDRSNQRGVILWTSLTGFLLVLVSVYTGSQTEPYGEFNVSNLTIAFVASIALAGFKALMYVQQRAGRQPPTYRVLFTNSWRNFLILCFSGVFTLLFWLVLVLWASLFDLIGIGFFHDLFLREDWFVFPVLTVGFGLAVTIFRDLTRIIDGITRLLHGLIKLLLPLIVAIAVLFLLALPFVGLDALWSTGAGTSLLLGLLAVTLFCTNAVYQDGRESVPYSKLVHRLIYIGLCTMPVLSVLSFYGLWQRIAQYGWTVERAWGVTVWAILTLFAVGYVVGIIRRRDLWTGELARWNTTMGLVVLAVMLLANSPLLDYRKLSLSSQLARVESGEIDLVEFDFWYADRNLGRPAYLAMQDMRADIGATNPEVLALIDNPVDSLVSPSVAERDAFLESLRFRPEPFEIPEAVRLELTRFYRIGDETPVLVRIDLDEDGQDEILLLREPNLAVLYYLENGVWVSGNVQRPYRDTDVLSLTDGEIRLVEPRFKDLDIGGIRLQINTRD